MSVLRLPRMISDGMVLQRNKHVRIWGEDVIDGVVSVTIGAYSSSAKTNKDGKFEVVMPEMEPGGPYEMTVCDDGGESITVSNVYIGDVWLTCGQSNMEFPMSRVKDTYPEEMTNVDGTGVRIFKVMENGNMHGPLFDTLSGSWIIPSDENILTQPAIGYFAAKKLYADTNVYQGIVNVSLGGSPIEAWMSEEMLKDYPELLKLRDRYANDEYRQHCIDQNGVNQKNWFDELEGKDQGLLNNWQDADISDGNWQDIEVPLMFSDHNRFAGFAGSVWLTKTFEVSAQHAGEAAVVWLGTITDSDRVFVNGVKIGETGYCYPPRRYPIPAGLLKEGTNRITVRMVVEKGKGRITPKKVLGVVFGQCKRVMVGGRETITGDSGFINLSGMWKYCIGAEMNEYIKPLDFVNWKPTALYNGMLAPVLRATYAGMMWYQGESNTSSCKDVDYQELMLIFVKSIRRINQDKELPFIYAQLPNFDANKYDVDLTYKYGWQVVRINQEQLRWQIDNGGLVCLFDLGEDNDLHPQMKKEAGERFALIAERMSYDLGEECKAFAPVMVDYERRRDKKTGQLTFTLIFSDTFGGLYKKAVPEKSCEITDFILYSDEKAYRGIGQIKGECVELVFDDVPADENGLAIVYCPENIATGALIYNNADMPMMPFYYELTRYRNV